MRVPPRSQRVWSSQRGFEVLLLVLLSFGMNWPVRAQGLPAAREGDPTTHAGVIVGGSPTVLINGLPAARLSSLVSETGCIPSAISNGSATVLIGG